MKKALAVGLAALVTCGVARAEYSISTDLTFATSYVFRGIQLGNDTLHPSIEASQDDFYAGFWGALPINNLDSKGWINEFDFYGGYGIDLGDDLTLDLGGTYYYYPQGDSTTEFYAGLSGTLGAITPSVYAYYDVTLEALTLQASFGYSLPMESVGSSLDLSLTGGYVKPDEDDSYYYWGASAVIPFKVSENATISAGLHYSRNTTDMEDRDWVYGTIGLTLGF
jgi:hypothetical protein